MKFIFENMDRSDPVANASTENWQCAVYDPEVSKTVFPSLIAYSVVEVFPSNNNPVLPCLTIQFVGPTIVP